MSKIDKAKKLLELVKRGVGGEQQNAEALLDKFLKKEGLTLEDIDEEVIKDRKITCNTKYERKLMLQVLAKVLNRSSFDNVYKTGNARVFILELTDFQWAEFGTIYFAVRKAWKDEIDISFSAFIQVNRLFKESNPDDNSSCSGLSEKDRLALLRAESMSPVECRKQIDNKGE